MRRARALLALLAALALVLALPVAGASAASPPRTDKAAKRHDTGFEAWWLAAGGIVCLGAAMVAVRMRPRRLPEGIA